MRKIGTVTPYMIDDYLVVSLSRNWVNIYQSIPTFDVFLDEKNRMHLVISENMKSGDVVSE